VKLVGMAERQIVGLGGGMGDTPEQRAALLEFVLRLTGRSRPKVLFLPTALADSAYTAAEVVDFYDLYRANAEASHVFTFPWPPEDLRSLLLGQDAICVSGGNTANMLAIWRVHGIDTLLREAWEQGVVLFGASAGMICWFEHGVTDSFGPQLEGIDCLGWLSGSACPHYDGEPRRRPRYTELVANGLAPGLAADDGVGLHYVGTELREIVSCRPGAAAYRVTAEGEERLEPRMLS
jgi:peptidase E